MARQRVGQQRPGGTRAPYRGPGRQSSPTLGVDVGGVIVALSGRDEDTSFFGSRPLETPAVAGVFEALATLTAEPFASRVHLVSKAGPKVAANTRGWLTHHDFFDRTGIPEANLHFVRERRDKHRCASGSASPTSSTTDSTYWRTWTPSSTATCSWAAPTRGSRTVAFPTGRRRPTPGPDSPPCYGSRSPSGSGRNGRATGYQRSGRVATRSPSRSAMS